ncbi:hypothetical protein AMATHDRAFT_8213 [Amanita thiersii Skay4041]|uniref:Uncharacterized protein n=1 Tax=Amanita thiersii Skay4041 TaxID=703135 RepID=A0A2A9NEM3_9AGAR|nr:hypothetical protein AMATHDRAFT_8213 [Amanita thiersii Skay4041]
MNMEAILHRIVHLAQDYSSQHTSKKHKPEACTLQYWLSISANSFPQYITTLSYAFYIVKVSAKLSASS